MIDSQWIYHFNKDGEVIFHQEVLNYFPILSKLPKPELKYYILVYDYARSPYKFRPTTEAKHMSARMCFQKEEFEEDPDAVEEIRSAVYNEKFESISNLRNKIDTIHRKIEIEEDDKLIVSHFNTVDKLQSMLDRILEEIKEEDENVQLQKGRELSFLEKMQRNRKVYKLNKKNVRDIPADNKEEWV